MLMLPTPSATFSERLIQRSGSGETDALSSNSGLATPQDEDVRQLGPFLDLKHATAISSRTQRHHTLRSRKEHEFSEGDEQDRYSWIAGEARVVETPSRIMARMVSSGSEISNVSQSPEFEDPEVTHARAKKVYNLPNRHISIDIQEQDKEVTDSSSCFKPVDAAQPLLGLDAFFGKEWTVDQIGNWILRILCFLPWCLAVGGSIVICPSYLDTVTFHTGYLEPLSGIHRFAHWADHTFEHVTIFAAFFGFLAWLNPVIGILLGCAIAALATNAWHDFRLNPNIPLGEDDRQSVYLSITKFWLTDEFLNIRRESKGFMLNEGPGRSELVNLRGLEGD